VICATAGSQYLRQPIKKGDKGICIAANARLGGITGLGLGVASLVGITNLGGLVFLPIGNINWDEVDPDAVVISAPNGAAIQTDDELSKVIISEDQISMTYGDNSITINADGIDITGVLSLNGIPYLVHSHGGVTVGSGATGVVIP